MKEKAIIVGLNQRNDSEYDRSMKELENLAHACGLEVVDAIVQKSHNINGATYIGSGKVDEVRISVEHHHANRVIFNHELSPTQLRNLERLIDVSVQDRTALILEIFSHRARTREAKMQVALAEMQYMLPRLAGSYTSLGRQSGGVGTYNKGSGEKKINLDKRRVEQRITELKKSLDGVQSERHTQRKKRQRSTFPSVALVGYTNAGKSTLMNAFLSSNHAQVSKHVLQKDMLFATLDTSVRQVTLFNNRKILLSDTVGFVSDLPHGLVKAFGSTLEEVVEADLLLHVIDISNPDYEMQKEVTEQTLKEIGVVDIPILNVFNKSDMKFDVFPDNEGKSLYVSAKNHIGLDQIALKISDLLFQDYVSCELIIPYDKGSLVNHLNETAFVKETKHLDQGTFLWVECHESDLPAYSSYIVENDRR